MLRVTVRNDIPGLVSSLFYDNQKKLLMTISMEMVHVAQKNQFKCQAQDYQTCTLPCNNYGLFLHVDVLVVSIKCNVHVNIIKYKMNVQINF